MADVNIIDVKIGETRLIKATERKRFYPSRGKGIPANAIDKILYYLAIWMSQIL